MFFCFLRKFYNCIILFDFIYFFCIIRIIRQFLNSLPTLTTISRIKTLFYGEYLTASKDVDSKLHYNKEWNTTGWKTTIQECLVLLEELEKVTIYNLMIFHLNLCQSMITELINVSWSSQEDQSYIHLNFTWMWKVWPLDHKIFQLIYPWLNYEFFLYFYFYGES